MSEEKPKPVLDEKTLDKLLEAAFVLQEHNDARRRLEQNLERQRARFEAQNASRDLQQQPAAAPTNGRAANSGDYTLTLGTIVETQRQIQVRQLDLENAIALVAQRVAEIGGGSGAAIVLVEGASVRYRAVAGRTSPGPNTLVAAEKAFSNLCINTGQILRCDDTSQEAEIDQEECRRWGIAALVAAPVFFQGNVAGALELYYGERRTLTDHDVHTCQLMAGLVTEAMVRDEEATWKRSLASERAAMLEALEKLQPNLTALAEKPASDRQAMGHGEGSGASSLCRQCGHQILSAEQFCGECGSPRIPEEASVRIAPEVRQPENLLNIREQSEVPPPTDVVEASPLQDLALTPASEPASPAVHNPEKETGSVEGLSAAELPDLAELLRSVEETEKLEGVEETESPKEPAIPEEESENVGADSKALEKLTRPADWSSAASAKDFLEQLAGNKNSGGLAQFWSARRGDIYLAISVILVICVIVWGMMSRRPAGTNSAQSGTATPHQKAPDADLSLWDRMLIELGLAEAPAPPEDKGSPGVQVWVDERTALYYCPGTDLYGKTPKGKFESQREAQLDQFEPAYRKPCN